MNILDSDRLLRRVWLANGLLILLALVLAAAVAVFALISNAMSRRADAVAAPASVSAPGAATQPRAVRYSMPQEIRGTSTRLVHVFHGEAYEQSARLDESRRDFSLYSSDSPTVNILFLHHDGSARLLLDRPALIRNLNYPYSREDSVRRWIAYEIVTEDANGDRRLDQDDPAVMYISDLDGRNFRRVTPEGWAVISHTSLQPTQLLIAAVRAPRSDRKADEEPQRAFIYDLTTSTLTPHTQLDSVADQAGRILGRPRR